MGGDLEVAYRAAYRTLVLNPILSRITARQKCKGAAVLVRVIVWGSASGEHIESRGHYRVPGKVCRTVYMNFEVHNLGQSVWRCMSLEC